MSKKTEKTVIVAVEQLVKHRIYGKRMRQTHRIFAHDEAEIASFGDTIRIAACAPHSKMKRFNVDSIVKAFAIPGTVEAKAAEADAAAL